MRVARSRKNTRLSQCVPCGCRVTVSKLFVSVEPRVDRFKSEVPRALLIFLSNT
jgi:hypothetical protein